MTPDAAGLLYRDEAEITFDLPSEAEYVPLDSQTRLAVPAEGNAKLNAISAGKQVKIVVVLTMTENRSATEWEQTKQVDDFLCRVHEFSGVRDENAAIDEVIEQFEQWFEAGKWWACRRVLALADVDKLLPTVSLSILSMTLVEKTRLAASRQTFYRRVRRRLAAQYGEQEANDDLQGLD